MAGYPESRYLETVDGIHIGYQVFGDGPYDLVFNDGWMSNIDANWDLDEVADFQSRLSRNARVIMFDRRGFGISDRLASADSMVLEKSVDDLRAVLDAVGSERAAILGFEDGAATSLLFAASYPERTTGLILESPLVSYWKTSDFPWAISRRMRERGARGSSARGVRTNCGGGTSAPWRRGRSRTSGWRHGHGGHACARARWPPGLSKRSSNRST